MERKNQSSNSESEDTEDYMYWQQQEAQRTSAAVIHKRDVFSEQQKKMLFL